MTPEPPARLTAAHDLSRFDCGNDILNDWLRLRALKSEADRNARTFVTCVGPMVVGFYCLSAGSVERSLAPGAVRRNAPDQVPVAILGRLAVDRAWCGRGLGEDLLADAYRRILAASDVIAVRAVLVHALDDAAANFWRHQEFLEFPAASRTFFKPLAQIAATL